MEMHNAQSDEIYIDAKQATATPNFPLTSQLGKSGKEEENPSQTANIEMTDAVSIICTDGISHFDTTKEENKMQVPHTQSDDVYQDQNQAATATNFPLRLQLGKSEKEEDSHTQTASAEMTEIPDALSLIFKDDKSHSASKGGESRDCNAEKESADTINQRNVTEDDKTVDCQEVAIADGHEHDINAEERRQMESTAYNKGNERNDRDAKQEASDTINQMNVGEENANVRSLEVIISDGRGSDIIPEEIIAEELQKGSTDKEAHNEGNATNNCDANQEAAVTMNQSNAWEENENTRSPEVLISDGRGSDITAEEKKKESTDKESDNKGNERNDCDDKQGASHTMHQLNAGEKNTNARSQEVIISDGRGSEITEEETQKESTDKEADNKANERNDCNTKQGASHTMNQLNAGEKNANARSQEIIISDGRGSDINVEEKQKESTDKEVANSKINGADNKTNNAVVGNSNHVNIYGETTNARSQVDITSANGSSEITVPNKQDQTEMCAVNKKNDDGESKASKEKVDTEKESDIVKAENVRSQVDVFSTDKFLTKVYQNKSSECTGQTLIEPSADQDNVRLEYSELPSEPADLIEVDSSSSSISLAWKQPRRGANNVENYEIKYKECNRRVAKWISVVTETHRRSFEVSNLKCGTEYEFKIRALTDEGEEGPFSATSVKMSTRQSLAKAIQMDAKQIKKGKDGYPSIFKLPLYQGRETTNHRAKTRKCIFGRRSRSSQQEKTLMLVGATGSGKSTLIDGIINYITDVSWDDDFRFSLVDLTDEEKKKHTQQAQSQTEWITCYTIHKMNGSKIDFDLNIIDTPGFGDTRGIIRDKAIIDQIREFFTTPGEQGIAFLDAICFVTQAPMARLTPPQRYIFDAILSVFGQDVANNIFVLITFADGNEPPVREALKAANVPFQKSFKFNNSALFANTIGNLDEAKFGNLFWRMGQESFRIFFDELKFVEAKSLQLTTQVLQLRKSLEATIQGLQPQITEGMNKLNTIRQEREILKRHKTDIAANRNFIYEVDEIHMRKIDLPPRVYVTNCLTCNRTCHYPCRIPNDDGKRACAAMSNGSCKVCPQKCHWSVHRNNTFRFETYPVTVKKTYDELKQKYEIAQVEEKKQRSVIGKVKSAFSSLGTKVSNMVHDVRCYINKLNEIALRPNPLSDIDYINLLIESEKNERKYGWEERLRLFYKLREEAELVTKTSKSNYRPWGEDNDILSDDD